MSVCLCGCLVFTSANARVHLVPFRLTSRSVLNAEIMVMVTRLKVKALCLRMRSTPLPATFTLIGTRSGPSLVSFQVSTFKQSGLVFGRTSNHDEVTPIIALYIITLRHYITHPQMWRLTTISMMSAHRSLVLWYRCQSWASCHPRIWSHTWTRPLWRTG